MMERYSSLNERIKEINFEIANAASLANRDIKEITLMAVTKTVDPLVVNQAINAGVTLLGENKAQELNQKFSLYNKENCQIHFIGHLQSNKVKGIIEKVSMIESVDRLSLAQEINRCAMAINKVMPILIEVNIGNEPTKSGVLSENIVDFINDIKELSHIKVSGLMAIPPNVEKIADKERYFAQMHQQIVDIKAKNIDNIHMEILSMGMSQDFSLAIKHQSNIIRIGRRLFGERI